MAKKSASRTSLPPEVTESILHLGEHIRIARKRRKLTLDAVASRMFVTRKTLSRLENGDPGVSLAVLASALWVLGFENDIPKIAHPEKDKVGIYRERQNLPKRVRPSTKHDLDF